VSAIGVDPQSKNGQLMCGCARRNAAARQFAAAVLTRPTDDAKLEMPIEPSTLDRGLASCRITGSDACWMHMPLERPGVRL
jgi:hypothetical protein